MGLNKKRPDRHPQVFIVGKSEPFGKTFLFLLEEKKLEQSLFTNTFLQIRFYKYVFTLKKSSICI